MTLVRWKRFIWNLEKALPKGVATSGNFQIQAAVKEDERALREVILNALSLDYGWGDGIKNFRTSLTHHLDMAFDFAPAPALVVRHGQRIIAASLMSTDPDADNHLLSGPSVLSEYRNRGIGSALLLESLGFLKSTGMTQAYGVCRDTSSAAKFLYRKFNSTNEVYEPEPHTVEERSER